MSFICAAFFLKAQTDTLYLDDITISGKMFQRFSTGSSYELLSVEPDDARLNDVLADERSIYFKSYGNNQLATISFRGTSSSQTQVLWHGIPANYPTLGQLDFSQWPVWLIESIGIQAGSAGALYGSGSIGGTILLDSDINPAKEGNETSLRVEVGSFGHFFAGAKAGYKLNNWSGKTAIFRSYIENDFPYELNGQEIRQPNASVLDYGVQQQLVYRYGNHKVALDGMMTQNDREIQPSKLSPTQEDMLETGNIRLAVVHSMETGKSSLTNTVAYLQSDQLYNEAERTKSDQYALFSTYGLEVYPWLAFRAGVNINRFTAESAYYTNRFTDYQTALFGSAEIKVADWWKTVVNLRQSFYKNNSPFTPSLGHELAVFQNLHHKINFNQQLSWGFRFPTLNDLHWSPGGNPDLKPEESLNAEAGLKWQFRKKLFRNEFSVTGFKTWSENWITWLPQGAIWSPVNFREVEITGLETYWKSIYVLDRLKGELSINYSFTRSLNKIGSNEGNQLPYTPVHNAGFRAKGTLKDWTIHVDGRFTGLRYTTLDNTATQAVDRFLLTDLGVRKNFAINSIHLKAGFLVRNLFNKEYENLINRAMPGRNYQMYLSLKL